MARISLDLYDKGTQVDLQPHPSDRGYLLTLVATDGSGERAVAHLDYHTVTQLLAVASMAPQPAEPLPGLACEGSDMPDRAVVADLARVRAGYQGGDAA